MYTGQSISCYDYVYHKDKYLYVTRTRDVKLPCKAHKEDAGYDFFIPNDMNPITIEAGKDVLIPAGVKVIVPDGYALVAMNKSGVATKLKLRTGACVIDTGYTGEVHIHLFNDSNSPVTLNPGQKIVQFVLLRLGMRDVEELDNETYEWLMQNSTRGAGGFGSTGSK